MDNFVTFFSFQDPNIRYVVFGSVLLASSAAIVGTFIFLKKKALVGDAVAHSVLPGICVAFLIAETKNPFILVLGAFVSGWISLVLLDYIVAKSKIKEDTAIGLILSVFFGLGILMLTIIQHSGMAGQSGLDSFLFGKAAALVGNDLVVFSSISILIMAVVFILFKELRLIAFDTNFAVAIGFPVRSIELVLTTLTVLAVVVGIQAVGVVLMAAMLITPAAAARFWTDKLPVMLLLAAIFGAISGVFGAYISYVAPAMPTGPWIVMVISFIAISSFFFAPTKGIVIKSLLQRRFRMKILEENILKIFFRIGEENKDFKKHIQAKELQKYKHFSEGDLKRGLRRLRRQGFIEKTGSLYQQTIAGNNKGKRVVKLHRLWEVYLMQYLRIAPDHVHEDAESIEHIITPEIEKELEEKLNFPQHDPHQSQIPYQ